MTISPRTVWLGRQRELGDLEAGLADLATGRGGLYLVAGEPGIGKTRLCDELVGSAAARGIAVHWGRAWEAGGAPSYWPFIQILRSTRAQLDAADELAALSGTAAQSEQFELFDAVNLYLHRLAAQGPQLLVLDDLHAADPSSIRMLHFVVRDLRTRPLMIVGTYREAEARMLLEIGRTLARVAREAVVLPLRRLDRREVAEFVALATGTAPSDERIDAIYQRTEGNPLFLRELLQLGGTSLRPPDGIREVVRARLAPLSPDVRGVLAAAAVLGRELATSRLAAVAGITDVATPLVPAIDAGIIEPLDDGARLRFTHVLLREAIYDDLDDERRGALHRRVADELRGRDGDAAELAHHMLRAVPAVSIADAADAALVAAERAIDVLAFEDAEAVLVRVVAGLEQAPAEAHRLFEVLLSLGVARIRALDPVGGRQACVRAAELARRLGDGELFARAVLGSSCEVDPGVRDAEMIALLDEALVMLPPGDGALRARCMSQLAAERQPEPDTAGPVALMREAIAMARRTGDADALRLTIGNAGLAMMGIADPAERLLLDQECLGLAIQAGDKMTAMRVHLMIGFDHAELGDVAALDAHLHAYSALTRNRKSTRVDLIQRSCECLKALFRGMYVEAAGLHAELEGSVGDDTLARDSIGGLAFELGLRRAREDYTDLPPVEARLRARVGAIHGELGSCLAEMMICQLYASAGDRQRAATQLAIVRAHPQFSSIREAGWLVLLVDAVHLLDDRELAAVLYPILLPRATRFFSLGPLGCYIEPPYGRALGLLAQTLGRLDDAVAHLTDAEQRTVRAGMVSGLDRLRRELASVTTGRPPVPASQTPAFSLKRDGDYWTISASSGTLRLRDSRGLQVLDQLVGNPGHELHVLQLVGPGDGDRDDGDAGSVLDPKAVQSYRRRLLDLREELDLAEQRSDRGRIERASAEIEMLTQELAHAVGLGGRERRVGGAAERARTTIQKRLRNAIERIEEGLPDVGRHLDQTIRTGMFCGYLPAGRPRK